MKFNSKEEFITEAEKRGIKEGVPFKSAWYADIQVSKFNKAWTWDDFNIDLDRDTVSSFSGTINNGYRVWIYDEGTWATPLETPLEDRVKALEEEMQRLKAERCEHKENDKPPQTSRQFIMEGIIEKIYPKDKEKAIEALVNIARIEHEPLDKSKEHESYHDELYWMSEHNVGNSFEFVGTEQGYDYWFEIHRLLS